MLAGLRERRVNADHVLTSLPRHAVTLAQEAARNYDVLVAVGGDGTVNEVASGLLLARTPETVLGIVPFGTGNDVAQLIGIHDLAGALAAIEQGRTVTMDAIEVHCHDAGQLVTRHALLFAAVGFAGELLKHTTPAVKRIFGAKYCYSVGFFRALFRYRAPQMKIRCGDQEFQGRMFLACAGNAEYAGGGVMRLSPGTSISDGLLNVSVIESMDRWEIARNFPRLLRGTHVGHAKVRYFTATSLAIETDPVIEIQVDGDLSGYTPATFQLKPSALKVLSLRHD